MSARQVFGLMSLKLTINFGRTHTTHFGVWESGGHYGRADGRIERYASTGQQLLEKQDPQRSPAFHSIHSRSHCARYCKIAEGSSIGSLVKTMMSWCKSMCKSMCDFKVASRWHFFQPSINLGSRYCSTIVSTNFVNPLW